LIDFAVFSVGMRRALADCGLPVGPERSVRLAQALALAPPATRDQLYWTARAVFVSDRDQVAAFDGVFAWAIDGLSDTALRGDQNAPPLLAPEPLPGSLRPERSGDLASGGVAPGRSSYSRDELTDFDKGSLEVRVAAASSAERLSERNFDSLDPDELRALRRLMSELALAPPPRVARRMRRDPHGVRLDVRATIRASRRTGGDPVRQVLRRRVERPRKLVVLCDISGSMEPYSRAFLQLLHAAVGGAQAEAFVFATRLTRLTRALRSRQPDLALERAAAVARDWSSGTLLGESLRRFNDFYGRRGMARGAVVVIISDGWERGDPALVAREMARLRRLAFRIVWVNPRKASSAGYEPLVGGMAAALPYCDAFVSGHSVRALSAVADAVSGCARLSGARKD
jgi:uncharacterized protein with von Willebrand factor type A (vWA) domain